MIEGLAGLRDGAARMKLQRRLWLIASVAVAVLILGGLTIWK